MFVLVTKEENLTSGTRYRCDAKISILNLDCP